MSFLPSTLTAYIFALNPTNSVIIAPLFSSFIRPDTFLFARGIHVVCRIIARVESSDIVFHILINIVAFYMINEIVRIGAHDLAFIAIHRWHVLVVKFIQTDFRYVEYAHTAVNRLVKLYLEFAHFDGDQIFRKDTMAVKIQFRRSLPPHRTVRPILLLILHQRLRIFSMVLPNTALFISLYKFFSKSFFARVLNCVLSSM